MFLLYADESGTPGGSDQEHFVLAGITVFVDSRATRLIQLADLVAYAIFRKYEKSDSQFYEIIERKFDFFGGVQHGLHVSV